MKSITAIIFLHSLLSIIIVSCQRSPDRKPSFPELESFTATYVEGDDGLKRFSLAITEADGIFSAEEVSTDNYSISKISDTLRASHLDEKQIARARQFLAAASELPSQCEQPTSLTQELTVNVSNRKISTKGNCDWKDASYFDLRKVLFNLKN